MQFNSILQYHENFEFIKLNVVQIICVFKDIWHLNLFCYLNSE